MSRPYQEQVLKPSSVLTLRPIPGDPTSYNLPRPHTGQSFRPQATVYFRDLYSALDPCEPWALGYPAQPPVSSFFCKKPLCLIALNLFLFDIQFFLKHIPQLVIRAAFYALMNRLRHLRFADCIQKCHPNICSFGMLVILS